MYIKCNCFKDKYLLLTNDNNIITFGNIKFDSEVMDTQCNKIIDAKIGNKDIIILLKNGNVRLIGSESENKEKIFYNNKFTKIFAN